LKPSLVFYPIKTNPEYLITKDGIVFSTITKRILEPIKGKTGYLQIGIRQKTTHFIYLHRLLAETFIDNPNNLPEVNHIDGNKLNNNLSNLEWVTGCENVRHAFANNLTRNKASCNYSLLDNYTELLLKDPVLTFTSLAKKEHISDPSSLRKLLKRHLLREGKQQLWEDLLKEVKHKGKTSKKVILKFPSGEEVLCDSQREAGLLLGVQPSAICLAIKNKKPCVGVLISHA